MGSFGGALIVAGLTCWGLLVVSLKQYMIDNDIMSIIGLSVVGLVFIVSGILVIRWARKKKNRKKEFGVENPERKM